MLRELEKQKLQPSGLTGIKFEHSDTLQVPRKDESRFKPPSRTNLGVDKITIEEPKTKRRLNKVSKNDVEWIGNLSFIYFSNQSLANSQQRS